MDLDKYALGYFRIRLNRLQAGSVLPSYIKVIPIEFEDNLVIIDWL